MKPSTHIRVDGDDYDRLVVIARFTELHTQQPITKKDMFKLLIDKFYDCYGDEIDAMLQSAKLII